MEELITLGKTLDILLSLRDKWPERKDELWKDYVNLNATRNRLIKENPGYKYTAEDGKRAKVIAKLEQIERDRIAKIEKRMNELKAQIEELENSI